MASLNTAVIFVGAAWQDPQVPDLSKIKASGSLFLKLLIGLMAELKQQVEMLFTGQWAGVVSSLSWELTACLIILALVRRLLSQRCRIG